MEYMTAREVAKLVGKSKDWVIKMARAGRLKAYRFGHMLAITKKDFDTFIEEYEAKKRAGNPAQKGVSYDHE